VQLSSCNYSAIIWLHKINDEIIFALKFYEFVGAGWAAMAGSDCMCHQFPVDLIFCFTRCAKKN
jgi:hypothetical protein